MSTYTAPTQDIHFVLNEIAGLGDVATLPGFEDATPDLVEAVIEEAGKLASDVLAPLNRSGDIENCHFENGVVRTPKGSKDAYRQFIEGGWNGVPFDPDFGGQGLPWLVSTAVSEIWNSANMAFSLCPLLTQGTIELLTTHGSDELQATFLEKLISGEWNGTMNLTESQAGTDLARIKSKAARDGQHYRISGQKIFITFGEHDLTDNIIHMVLARLPDAPEGVKGISLFLVPKFLVNPDGSLGERNDLKCVSIEHKLGINASPTAVMSYGDNDGAIGYLVGAENEGIKCMFTMMNNARLAVGLEGVAIAERAYQQARDYALERVQSRDASSKSHDAVTIIHHPDVKRMLLSMKSRTEATRALAYSTAATLDTANRHPDSEKRASAQAMLDLLIPVVKAWSTDIGIDVANIGVQVHGGMGYIEETGAAQHLRDARIASIYEGTNGIQAIDLVGRKVVRENGETIGTLIADIRRFAPKAANDDLTAIAERLETATNALEKATAWVVETFPTDPNAVLAGANSYLSLLGLTLGGWMMGRAAEISLKKLEMGQGDPAFYKAKINSARFFADQVLVEAASHCEKIVSGSVSITQSDFSS
ncbi:MAG: acyl-CoA dehydrogenase [Rhodospirillaceae bacterium]|jgi:3-(methylthio)propanoyl-CoA dehydrogenase|nr:acyl-CoA dehydrogenase [Rhodospirillaceae bacterium]MBT5244210.1 acyl-CoA dehydrogenase [Rhodospirillaceae bacterium]MBT5561735.1 acyl-CoA dehydrogenase [Rhodospirillaceae bacterium]MBT6243174.1 acyl-CoA dehydrogenase [Rhodospirillaceae bacterium]MBT7137433.1 acyl-CoA dehydrogenase [Rhodospirillaceae bacterium]